MNSTAIADRGSREMIIYDTAKQVRELLDKAAAAYGEDAWLSDDLDAKVIELVTEEDE